jgi:protein O-mannosyl-transferase
VLRSHLINGRWTRSSLIGLLLALITLVAFWPVRNCRFINFDDPVYVTANSHVQGGLNARGIAWAFQTGQAGNWHPLTWLSHMVDWDWFGPEPAGPHLINLLLHAANTVLLFLLLQRLTGAVGRSVFVAALFALHPLHVESVAWVAERKDVLSTFFGLLVLLSYRSYTTHKTYKTYLLSLSFFALALMSKPMWVTLPLILLLLDYWPLQRVSGEGGEAAGSAPDTWHPAPGTSHLTRLIAEKWPFILLSAASCIVTFLVQRSAGAVSSLVRLPLGARIENSLVSCLRYLAKTFWPVDLAIPYPHPGHWPFALVLFAAVLIVGVSVLALCTRRTQPFLFTGWFWFLITLLPVIGLVQVGNQSLADRYMYVPSIGLFLALAWGATARLERWRWPRPAIAVPAVLILAVCAARTRDQLRYWQDSETLFRHAIAVTENNYLAHDNLGFHLYTKGRLDEAYEQYQQALRIHPGDPSTLNNLGSLFATRKQFAEAIRCYEAALKARPDYADAHNNLGVAHYTLGDHAAAFVQFNEALRLAPDNAQAHLNLANVSAANGKFDDAIAGFRRALSLQPDFPEALNNLGLLWAARGQTGDAIALFERALQLEPEDELIHKNLGDTLAAVGRNKEALEQYAEALRLVPDYADAHIAAGRLLARMGRGEEARKHLTEALRLRPEDAEAKRLLKELGTD